MYILPVAPYIYIHAHGATQTMAGIPKVHIPSELFQREGGGRSLTSHPCNVCICVCVLGGGGGGGRTITIIRRVNEPYLNLPSVRMTGNLGVVLAPALDVRDAKVHQDLLDALPAWGSMAEGGARYVQYKRSRGGGFCGVDWLTGFRFS